MNRIHSKWLSITLVVFASASLFWLTTARGIQPEFGEEEDKPAIAPIDNSPLLVEPKTAEEHFAAVSTMVDLGSFELGRQYLSNLLALKPSDDELLAIRKKHGSAILLQFSNTPQLKPDSVQLLNLVNAAAKKRNSDPEYLDGIISELLTTPQKRASAISDLQSLGPAVIPQIISRWEAEEAGDRRDWFQYAILRIGDDATPALLGALHSPNEEVQAMAINTLGRFQSKIALPDIGYFAYSPGISPGVQSAARAALAKIQKLPESELVESGAVTQLYQSANEIFQGRQVVRADVKGQVEVWSWNTEKERLTSKKMSSYDASLQMGLRHIQRAVLLSPGKQKTQALLFAFLFEIEKRQAGWENPVDQSKGSAFDLGLAAGANVVLESLELALKNRKAASAVLAMEVLAKVAKSEQLSSGKKTSALVQALDSPNLRVQFQAADTIMQLHPEKAFRGSSRVTEIFGRALHYSGEAHALIIDPNSDRASRTAGAVGELGYSPVIARTGRDGFKIAAARSDIAFVLIHANSVYWTLTPTITNFRADVRTAGMPIGLFAPLHLQNKMSRLALRANHATFVEETGSSTLIARHLNSVLAGAGNEKVTGLESARMAKVSVGWLTAIAVKKQDQLFDLPSAKAALFEAAGSPDLAFEALTALGSIPSADAQKRMTDIAMTPSHTEKVRVHALNMLTLHVKKYGLLLSLEKLKELTDAWKNTSDAKMRIALSSLMGVLRPNNTRVGEYLEDYLKSNAQ